MIIVIMQFDAEQLENRANRLLARNLLDVCHPGLL